jgi:hypothetical protein
VYGFRIILRITSDYFVNSIKLLDCKDRLLIFVIDKHCGFFEVGTEVLNCIYMNIGLKRINNNFVTPLINHTTLNNIFCCFNLRLFLGLCLLPGVEIVSTTFRSFALPAYTIGPVKQNYCKKGKVVPLHAMEAHGGRGGITPTHT